jgi:hypothetical protein
VRREGVSKAYVRRADSGFEIRMHFCPECGTTVYLETDKTPDICGIPVGCFADPAFPTPTVSVWEETQHTWLGLPEEIAHLPKGIGADGRPTK